MRKKQTLDFAMVGALAADAAAALLLIPVFGWTHWPFVLAHYSAYFLVGGACVGIIGSHLVRTQKAVVVASIVAPLGGLLIGGTITTTVFPQATLPITAAAAQIWHESISSRAISPVTLSSE